MSWGLRCMRRMPERTALTRWSRSAKTTLAVVEPSQQRPDAFDGVEVGSAGGQLDDGEPVLSGRPFP